MRADSERVPPTPESHFMGYGHRHGEEHADVGMGIDGNDPGADKDKIEENVDILSEAWYMEREKPEERDQQDVSEMNSWTEDIISWDQEVVRGNKNMERWR